MMLFHPGQKLFFLQQVCHFFCFSDIPGTPKLVECGMCFLFNPDLWLVFDILFDLLKTGAFVYVYTNMWFMVDFCVYCGVSQNPSSI